MGMAIGGINPTYDTEAERLKEQLAYADALRKQGMSGDIGQGYQGGRIYIRGNGWGNALSGIAGALLGEKARQGQAELEQQQTQARNDWLGQMPAATEQQTYNPETNPGTGPLLNQAFPKSAKQRQQEMTGWAMKAPRGMEGVQNFALQQSMLAPKEEQAREEAALARTDQLRMQAEERRAAKAEADARLFEQQRFLKQMGLDNAKALMAMRQSGSGGPDMRIITTTDANGNPVQQAVDMNAVKPGQTFGKYVVPPKPSSAEVKQAAADEGLSSKLDDAIKSLMENPDAVGLKTLTPDLILQRTDPEGIGTRAKIGEIGAEKAHALYGAAFSASEQKRANKFIPQNGDDYQTTMTKMQNMKKLVDESRARRAKEKSGGAAVPVQQLSDEELLNQYRGSK